MKRTNIYITDMQYRTILAFSKKSGIKFSEMVRRLLDESIANKIVEGAIRKDSNA